MKKLLLLFLLAISLISCNKSEVLKEDKNVSPLNEVHNTDFEEDGDTEYYKY